MFICNLKKRGGCVITSQGVTCFNDDGIAEVGEDLALRLASLKGYEIVEEPPSADGLTFEAMTLAQLKQYAGEKNISLDGATKKHDIIAILRGASK